MIKFSEFNEEVLYTTETVTKVDSADINYLKMKSKENKRKRESCSTNHYILSYQYPSIPTLATNELHMNILLLFLSFALGF